MRNFIKTLGVSSALFLALALGVTTSRAQETRSARDVAALVQSFYDQSPAFEARFQQRQVTRLQNRTEQASGRVVFEKPGKMRWDYDAPNGQVYVSDGNRLIIYQPAEEGEEHGQIIDREINDHQLPQAFSFLTGTGRLDRDFTFRLLDPDRYGMQNGYVLELRPRQPTAHYDKILFFVRVVEQGGRSAGIIRRVLIVDSAGNRNRFDFSEMTFPREVADARFRFRAPAGTRRVQP